MASLGKEIGVALNGARLKRRLKAVTDLARPEVSAEMANSADDTVRLMRHLVAVDQGDARDSITWVHGNPPPTKATGAIRLPSGSSSDGERISIFAGNEKAYYVRWLEFGTRPSVKGERVRDANGRKHKAGRTHTGTTAQPFFFPAWRANRKNAKKAIAKAIRKAIRKAMDVQ